MDDSKAVKNDNAKEQRLADRKSDATDNATLSEIEESEKETSSDSNMDSGPSPDGRLDESDELKDADPM